VGLGAAAGAVLLGYYAYRRLTSPVEAKGVPTVTPHGHFGAHREGPPVHSHQGVDLAARPGSRVLAIGNGTVVATDPGLGKLVRKLQLDKPAAFGPGGELVHFVVYADLGKALVEPGQRVRKGDAIALVSSQGFVHFAVKSKDSHGETFFDPKLAGFNYRAVV
jgi:murein DD-endopeptidase MepM/ murein hydrolase activator NlpD